jgi:hypothetical protein
LADGPHERLLGAGLAAGGDIFGHGVFDDLPQAAARCGAIGGKLGNKVRGDFMLRFKDGSIFILGSGDADLFGQGEGFLLLLLTMPTLRVLATGCGAGAGAGSAIYFAFP